MAKISNSLDHEIYRLVPHHYDLDHHGYNQVHLALLPNARARPGYVLANDKKRVHAVTDSKGPSSFAVLPKKKILCDIFGKSQARGRGSSPAVLTSLFLRSAESEILFQTK